MFRVEAVATGICLAESGVGTEQIPLGWIQKPGAVAFVSGVVDAAVPFSEDDADSLTHSVSERQQTGCCHGGESPPQRVSIEEDGAARSSKTPTITSRIGTAWRY
jgi:hypothetical protein